MLIKWQRKLTTLKKRPLSKQKEYNKYVITEQMYLQVFVKLRWKVNRNFL